MGRRPDAFKGDESSLLELADALKATGEALASDPIGSGTSQLTDLQVILEQALSGAENAQLRFILFFLSLFVDDVKYNFVGDFPFNDKASEGFQLRDKFLRELGQTLARISADLAGSNYAACTTLAATIAGHYLETVRAMNTKHPIAGRDHKHVS
jgi:hypothetical protein